MRPLELDVGAGHGDSSGGVIGRNTPGVEPVTAFDRFRIHRTGAFGDEVHGRGLRPEPLKLRVAPVVPGRAAQYRLCKPRLAPQRNQALRVYGQHVVENARTLAATLAERGIGIVGGGTDTHMVLLDLASEGLMGSQAETALARAGITSNKNPVPFDARSPSKWTGLRLGVSAATTRGFRTADMEVLGECIADLLHAEAHSDPEPARLRARLAACGTVRA